MVCWRLVAANMENSLEFQKQVQSLRNGFGLQQEICPRDIKGCSTASLLIDLFHISSDLRWCKRENRTQKIRDFIRKIVHKVESEMQSGPEQARIQVNRVAEGLSDVAITMTNRGMVWFSSWVKSEHGPQVLNHVNRTWQSMREQMNQGLGELLPDGTCRIRDLVTFVLNLKRFRNQIGLKMLSLQQVFDKLFVWHVGFLSKKLDELFVGIALERLDAGFVPPARVTPGGHVKVDTSVVWQLVPDARARKHSLLETLQTHLLDSEREQFNSRFKDCSESQAWNPQTAYLNAYLKRARVLLRNATQFSLVTDASTHSDTEVVVSLCHADDHSMMVPIAICKQGQIDVTDVDLPSFSQLSDIAEKQKIERERAYHFIKAISHALDVLTSGRVNIATFKIDGDTSTSRPVKSGEHRVRRSQQGMLHVGDHSDNAEGHSDNAEGLSDNVGGHRDNDINDGFIYVTEHVAHVRKVDGSLVPVLPTNLPWQMQ